MTSIHTQGIGMTSQRTRSRLIARLAAHGITDQRVLDVMEKCPRHLCIEEALRDRAYEDNALPIGYGQTISQPYIVARMTEALLSGGPLERVLEIGTGSGYQAIILSHFAKQVYTLERVKSLYERARRVMHELKIKNVTCMYGDGSQGLAKYAPFDGIIVTAAPSNVPTALIEQLSPKGGRLVVPIGEEDQTQELRLITRQNDDFSNVSLDLVRFVPMLKGTC